MTAAIGDLPTHPERGWPVDPETGTVYGASRQYVGRPLGTLGTHGYLVTSRCGRSYLLHRVVWETCVGPIPADMVINHLNGVKTDNRLCNLEVVTQAENVRHALDNGLGRAWITPEIKEGIRQMLDAGFSKSDAGRTFGVSRLSVARASKERA